LPKDHKQPDDLPKQTDVISDASSPTSGVKTSSTTSDSAIGVATSHKPSDQSSGIRDNPDSSVVSFHSTAAVPVSTITQYPESAIHAATQIQALVRGSTARRERARQAAIPTAERTAKVAALADRLRVIKKKEDFTASAKEVLALKLSKEEFSELTKAENLDDQNKDLLVAEIKKLEIEALTADVKAKKDADLSGADDWVTETAQRMVALKLPLRKIREITKAENLKPANKKLLFAEMLMLLRQNEILALIADVNAKKEEDWRHENAWVTKTAQNVIFYKLSQAEFVELTNNLEFVNKELLLAEITKLQAATRIQAFARGLAARKASKKIPGIDDNAEVNHDDGSDDNPPSRSGSVESSDDNGILTPEASASKIQSAFRRHIAQNQDQPLRDDKAGQQIVIYNPDAQAQQLRDDQARQAVLEQHDSSAEEEDSDMDGSISQEDPHQPDSDSEWSIPQDEDKHGGFPFRFFPEAARLILGQTDNIQS
jgi:hypothetical protein